MTELDLLGRYMEIMVNDGRRCGFLPSITCIWHAREQLISCNTVPAFFNYNETEFKF